MSSVDTAALWGQLRQRGLVEGDAPAQPPGESPWYVRTMLGIAGFIGALFLVGFVSTGFAFIVQSPGANLVVGTGVCAAAILVYRVRPQGDFINQFAFAVSLTGQGLIGFGIGHLLPSPLWLPVTLFGLVEAALFLLTGNFLHRVWTAWAAAVAFAFALDTSGFFYYTQAVVFAVFVWVWLNELRFAGRRAQMRALGYGLVLCVCYELAVRTSAHMLLGAQGLFAERYAPIGGAYAIWIGPALIGLIAIWLIASLLRREAVALSSPAGRAALGGGLLVGLISLKAPGIGVTLGILLLGYANGNRVLAGLGILGLLTYWSYYYYSLQLTLLQKSALLVCAGAALIVARMLMQRRFPVEGGQPHA